MPDTKLTPDQLRAQLEKHGLPIYGTDAELQTRYDRNLLGKPPALPQVPTVHKPREGNVLLANRVAKDAPLAEIPETVEVTSENVHDDKGLDNITSDAVQGARDILTAFGPRKPGRPPKVQ